MDKLDKTLQRLSDKEKLIVKKIIKALQEERFDRLDIKKLKGYNGIFRVRRRKIRIVYKFENKDLIIIKIDRRRENTYKL